MGDARDLAAIRAALTEVDEKLVLLMAERMRLGRAAGAAKREAGIQLRDELRERQALAAVERLATQHGLDVAAVHDVFDRLMAMSREAQGA